MITKEAIEKAHDKIKPYIHHTPVLTNSSINEMAEAELFFKCENFQKIGAFKIRGGMNAALSLSPVQIRKGLATHSSGNHAQAIAFAAKTLGTKAFIVMPENSPAVKVNAVKGYGAEVIFCAPNQAAREEALNKIVAETGAEFIHPYDDDRVITGQATCVKELIAIDLVRDEQGEFTGDILGTPSFREGKVTRVEAWLAARNLGWQDVETTFYSDSMNDLPLLEKATHPVATNPDERLRQLATERGWRILDLF